MCVCHILLNSYLLTYLNRATHLYKCNCVADAYKHAPPHMCYHTEFGRSALKSVGINTGESPKLGSAGTLLSWDGRRGWPPNNKPLPIFFPPRKFNAPAEWVPLGIGYWSSESKNQNDGATGPRSKFDDVFSCLDTLQYTKVTDGWQRDGRTDTGRQQRPCLRIASRTRSRSATTLATRQKQTAERLLY